MTAPVPVRRKRCAWAEKSKELEEYHDHEYGRLVAGDRDYLERMILEIFQAGLSWRTILAKRDAFRRAFAGFQPAKISAFTRADIHRLLHNPFIIRNRRKIEAAVANASAFMRIQKQYGSFRQYLRTLPLRRRTQTIKIFKRTFSFMGPKIVGEFLMSTGHWPVQHEAGCYLRKNAAPWSLSTGPGKSAQTPAARNRRHSPRADPCRSRPQGD